MADYRQMARDAAMAHGIDPDLFERQIGAESNFNPKAGSHAGAQGIAQFMPATAKGMGVDPWNPRSALYGSAKLMSRHLGNYGGDWRKALTAYNAGPGRVGKPLYDETRGYIQKIMGGSPSPTGGGGGQPSSYAAPASSGADRRLAFIMQGSPFEQLLASRAAVNDGGEVGAARPSAGGGPVPNVNVKKPASADWRWLQKIAQQRFGLKNDPGSSQTTGGRHTANSQHYSGHAIDFGDARNTRAQLNAWYRWAKANAGKYGFSEVLDEGDHIHVGMR